MEFDIVNEIITFSVGELFKQPFSNASDFSKTTFLKQPFGSDVQKKIMAKVEKKIENDEDSDDMNDRDENLANKKVETKGSNFKPSSTEVNYKNSNTSIDSKVSNEASKSTNISIKSLEDFKPKSATMKAISSSVTNMDSESSKKPGSVTVEQWISKEGPARFLESAEKLGLHPKTISKINVSYYSAQELANHKKNVKNELKEYDNAFTKLFGRAPNREEKEPMRPLYIFYKRLKQNIGKDENEKEQDPPKDKEKTRESERLQKPSSSSATSLLSGDSMKITSMKASSDRGSDKNSDSFDGFLNDNKKPKPAGTVKSEVQVTGPAADQLRKQLSELLAVKTDLREKLHEYQQDFQRNNNRKIKFHKDIAPVEMEYKKYKAIKNEIARIEGILGIE